MKIICILGATGTGKSKVGVELAQCYPGEIISADSRQIYRELDIGAAKPSVADQKGIPHHLLDVADLKRPWDVAQFISSAEQAIQDVVARGRLPFVVGGTGLYIKALLFGLFEGPKADEGIRKNLEAWIQSDGLAALHAELQKIDPEAAARIHPNDPTRIVRALEVHRLTGEPISQVQARHQFQAARYEYLKIGLNVPREELVARLEARVDRMIAEGLEQEVKNLVREYGAHPLLARSIGYGEWIPYFEGKISRGEVLKQIKQNTRHFAKRQNTWFRKEIDIDWFDPDDLDGMIGRVERFLRGGG